MIVAIGSLTLLGLTLGGLLAVAGRYLRVEGNPLAEQVVALLPGSQCGQCGYAGCGPAGEAIASGAASPAICPPGGRAVAGEIANLLGVALDLSGLVEKAPRIAFIKDSLCIGCCKCFKRCPTDAIMGANNMIHSVFTDACIGCEQCFAVCPTECIEMRPLVANLQTWFWPNPTALAAAQ